MTEPTPAEREEREAQREAEEAQGVMWLKVWQKAQGTEAVEFRRWVRDIGLKVSGPPVEHNVKMGRRIRDQYEERRAQLEAEG
ncbi:hypothetical protein HXS80_15915 [Streptomyces sp. CB04723]|uniref:hypothetical protein n=1 Tax=Streptomyces TaxID=1883 RepID=UPI0015C40FA6|nr:hypothetical protein [Streptomyces sp. CB04723]QLG33015.1 hypothetical protein HXS80_15915 [Streptomyces sp. CB04723]